MANREDEYKEIFLAEAIGNLEEVNRLVTVLEKHVADKETINALFRITHTLKGNAAGMGFTGISEISHVLEDLFGEARDGKIVLDEALFSVLFKAVDVLGSLIHAVRDNADVKYKGVKTKLEVLLRRTKERPSAAQTPSHAESNSERTHARHLNPADAEHVSESATENEVTEKLSFSDLVQVPVRKLDNLLTLVGELMIEKDRIVSASASRGRNAANEFARLSRISSDLQYSVMDVRLVQVGFLFNKFHRVIRDAATLEHKDVVLKLEGTDTEIDRNVLQVIGDSLIHLIRNCVGHGIEKPEERVKAGKSPQGTVTLSAHGETDSVIIEISDDGRGLDYNRIRAKAIAKGLITASSELTKDELGMLIFEPGFSTMDHVTAIAGRGVGMDVVKKTLDSIGGIVRLVSNEGTGTVIQLTLPASMAVKSSLLFELGDAVYAIPLAYTQAVISLNKTEIRKAGGALIASHLGKNISIAFLSEFLNDGDDAGDPGSAHARYSLDQVADNARLDIVVVFFNNRTVGFVVDKLLQQKEIVEKPLSRPLDRVKYISGYTILGSGNVCLVLNIPFVLGHMFGLSTRSKLSRTPQLN